MITAKKVDRAVSASPARTSMLDLRGFAAIILASPAERPIHL